MNIKAVFHLISYLLLVLALAIGVCWFVSHHFSDPLESQLGLAVSAGIVALIAAMLWFFTNGPVDLSRRDGFGIVTFGWVAASLAGALPYLLSGTISDPASAVFETMSGFTTTGASVLTNLETIPKGILFWRGLTQWFGGMGVLVLCVAILPFLGVGGMQIYRAEMPGPSKDRLTPRITSTAKLLWGVYALLTVLEVGLLMLGGMDWFDSFCHTFATMSTGGFSTRTASVAAFNSVYIETVIIIFMFLAGMNFALHFRALRGDVTCFLHDSEFRFYFAVWVISCLFLSWNVWGSVYPSFAHSLRAGFFQGTSIMTTTGFATEDSDLWPAASKVMLLILMCVGASAGSTAGGIKAVRVFVVLKLILREIRLFLQPQAVIKVKLGRQPLDRDVVFNIVAFFVIFILLLVTFFFIMTAFTPDLMTAFSSVAATLGNIGPGFSAVGTSQTYAFLSPTGKVILTFCMLLGRLELYTVLVLLMPSCWRR
ncbi:MAG: TrkH family potassium uptake protein [Verrucomicrobia bacterium]|nr:TrkH family potassium uptake protein [Verrucomicrobiota bacterium]